MLFDDHYPTQPHERRTFGTHWVGPDKLPAHKLALVAVYEPSSERGSRADVFVVAAPSRFYSVRAGSLHLTTGSDMHELVALVAEDLSTGSLRISPTLMEEAPPARAAFSRGGARTRRLPPSERAPFGKRWCGPRALPVVPRLHVLVARYAPAHEDGVPASVFVRAAEAARAVEWVVRAQGYDFVLVGEEAPARAARIAKAFADAMLGVEEDAGDGASGGC